MPDFATAATVKMISDDPLGRRLPPWTDGSAHGLVDGIVETQQVADHAAVEQGAVGGTVGEIGGFQLPVAELVEGQLCHHLFVVAEFADVENRRRFDGTDAIYASPSVVAT